MSTDGAAAPTSGHTAPGDATPILVDVVRDGVVESVHRGSVLALGADGAEVLRVGWPDDAVFPRSANKPFQAVAMLRCGLDLDGSDLALAAASHSGEPRHIQGVRRLLTLGGFTPDDLQCPLDLPLDTIASRAVLAAGGGPARILMNCSGKHAAMLMTCRVAGWSTQDYLDPSHPLQQEVRRVVEDFGAEPVAATGIDGCGAPLFAISLTALARAFARLVRAEPGSAGRRVADAMRSDPFLVAGTGREDTLLMQAEPGLLVKGGAEGVHAAALADGSAVALKIDDGAVRARVPVLTAVLRELGATASLPVEAVLGGGRPVGEVRLRPGALSPGPRSESA